MKNIFLFETLTWPEVRDLPRTTPLIIPLGSGYSQELIFEMLAYPSRIGFLPAIPFGWRGSGLSVHPRVFASILRNLLQSLREDGFVQVYVLMPPGLDLNLGQDQLVIPNIKSFPAFLPPDEEKSKVILFPIGHTEQHGYHLPLSTDSIIIEAISQRTAENIPDKAYSLPVFPYGVSTHRSSFAGTLNAGGRAFEDFWLAILDQLVNRGFATFYLMSGHGGNCSFLTNVVKYAGERYPHCFIATSWLYLSGPDGIASLERYRQSGRGGMGHACELETSLVQVLAPELVHMDRVVDEICFIETPSYTMDWVEGGALIANPPWLDDSSTGSYGAGSLANPEHGKIWLGAAIQEKIGHVDEILEQHTRRTQKRHANKVERG